MMMIIRIAVSKEGGYGYGFYFDDKMFMVEVKSTC